MKTPCRSLFITFVLGVATVVAHAQISEFTVQSVSGSGNYLQIAGLFVSQSALLDVQTSSPNPGVNNLVPVFGSYYSLQSSLAGSVLASQNNWGTHTTRIVNQYAPSLGYTSAAPITNCSGRFYIEAPVSVWDDDSGSWTQEGGIGATVSFTVTETRSFYVQVFGYNSLAPYGLVGAKSPYVYVYNASSWAYVGSFTGEGTGSIGTLSPGNYIMYVDADVDTDSGLVMASVNAN